MEENWIKTRIYPLPNRPSEDEYRECLQQLPAWRKQQAEAFRFLSDKLQCAKAYILLQSLLTEDLKLPAQLRFSYGPYGKPFLADYPHLHFNLSHCARAVMCVVSNTEVGCDVEEIPSQLEQELLDLCFSAEEQRLIRQSNTPMVEFTRLWTSKEALLKLHGTGLTDDLPSLMTSPLARGALFTTTICRERGYVYTTCTLRKQNN